jgi:hypothetical protein
MTDQPSDFSGAAGGQDASDGRNFGGSMGSQHKETQAGEPELEQGPSGSSPRQKPAPPDIGGQLGGIGGQTPPSGAQSGSPSPGQPSQSKRKSGCLALLLAAAGVSAALAGSLMKL